MKLKESVLIPVILGLLALGSCAPKVITKVNKTYPAAQYNQEVRIFDIEEITPAESEVLGQIVIKDNGFSINCGYEEVMNLARIEARKLGGNALKIIDHRWPSTFGSSCHQINATVLLISNQAIEQVTPVPENLYVRKESPANKIVDSGRKLRIAINGGPSWRIGETPEGISSAERDYLRELKSGYSFSAELTYQLNENVGLGGKFSHYGSKHSVSTITIDFPDGTSYTGPTSDNIKIQFIGPMLFTRQVSYNEKGAFTGDFSLGYLSYKNVSTLGPSFLQISGANVGLSFGAGYEFYLSKSVGLGLSLSATFGTLTKLEIGNSISSTTIKLQEGQYENLGRLDLLLGLRLYK
jgi:hypothetical protein